MGARRPLADERAQMRQTVRTAHEVRGAARGSASRSQPQASAGRHESDRVLAVELILVGLVQQFDDFLHR